jgi:hypothetical protein
MHRKRCAFGVSLAVMSLGWSGSLGEVSAQARTGRPTSSRSSRAGQPRAGWGAVPLPARLTVSRDLGGDRRMFSVSRTASGTLVAGASGVSAAFGVGGVVVRDGSGGFVRLGLSAAGRGESLRPMGAVRPIHRGSNQVDYRHPGVTESYVNGPLGLEQGFFLSRRPAGSGALTLAVGQLPPAARIHWGKGHAALTLIGTTGRSSLRYGELYVTDASGGRLHAWLARRGDRLLIRVDDVGARYPLRIDPTVQAAELTAGDGAAHDGLGDSVAISGDTIVAGAPDHETMGHVQQGAAYVFTKPSSGWADATQTAELTSSDGTPQDNFGSSVAADGDTIVVGAPGHNAGQGVAYVFTMPSSGGWRTATQTAELIPNDGTGSDGFGQSVGVSGTTVAIGAPDHNDSRGAVYEFTEPSSGVWVNASQTAELTANDALPFDQLGYSVAVDGATIVSGAIDHAVGSTNEQGAAYVFERPSSGVWSTATQTAELTASDGTANDGFGASVGISGGTIAVGAPERPAGSTTTRGAVYVYTMPTTGGWTNAAQTAELTGDDFPLGDSVAVSGDTIVSGESMQTQQQVAYEFTEPAAGGWQNTTTAAQLSATDAADNDGDGWYNVAISGNTVLAGAPGHQQGSNVGQGLVYVFNPGGSSGVVDPTSTTVTCSPSPVDIAATTTCHTSVTDEASDGVSAPTGTVSLQSSPNAGTFGDSGSCTLTATSTAGNSACAITFIPATSGSYTLTASYGGDNSHDPSTGDLTLTANPVVTPPAPTNPAVPPSVTTTPPTGSTTAPAGSTTAPAGSTRIGRRVTVSRKGVAKVSLSCAGSAQATCTGRLTLTADVRMKVKRKATPHGKSAKITNRLTLGSAGYRLAAGVSPAVSVPLSKAAVKLLQTARRHTIIAKLTVKPSDGKAVTETVTMTRA